MRRREPRQVELTITTLTDAGYGQGRVEQRDFGTRDVLVRDALPGETVSAVVRKRRGGSWYAEATDRQGTAAGRVSAPCAAFPRCGGCVLQHLDYPAQLAHKSQVVQRLVHEAGLVPERIHAPVASPQFHYRHKARLGVRRVGEAVLVGFRESFSNRVVRMDDCPALALSLGEALPELGALLAASDTPDRIPQVELAAGDRGAAFVIRHLEVLSARDLAAFAAFERGGERTVLLQPAGYDSVHPLNPESNPYLSYANPDFGLSLQFHPTDFTQVNPFINRALVQAAVLALDIRAGDAVLDLFCGIGNFSLALARAGARVAGFESGPGAVARAWHNARRNGLHHAVTFAEADLYQPGAGSMPAARSLLLDPPRSGAGPNLAVWAASPTLERIAYVSCNPVTFARDAAVLAGCGFKLSDLGVYDMFPHTAHVETLGVFQRGC